MGVRGLVWFGFILRWEKLWHICNNPEETSLREGGRKKEKGEIS